MPNVPPHETPDTLATPEGDNEQLPGEPLRGDEPPPERPRGDEPHPAGAKNPAM